MNVVEPYAELIDKFLRVWNLSTAECNPFKQGRFSRNAGHTQRGAGIQYVVGEKIIR